MRAREKEREREREREREGETDRQTDRQTKRQKECYMCVSARVCVSVCMRTRKYVLQRSIIHSLQTYAPVWSSGSRGGRGSNNSPCDIRHGLVPVVCLKTYRLCRAFTQVLPVEKSCLFLTVRFLSCAYKHK